MSDNYIVVARYNFESKYICIEEPSVDEFLNECNIAFNFGSNRIKVNLTDNRNAHINKDNFSEIVKRFSNSGSFFINIELIEEDKNMPIVSVKCFLVREKAEDLMADHEGKNDSSLSKCQLNLLIRILGKFIQHRYGLVPTSKQKEAVAKTLIEIFPSIQMSTLLNKTDGGKLGIQMRNARRGIKRRKTIANDFDIETLLSEEEAKQEVENLKSILVNSQNIDEIKTKLRSTLVYRLDLLKEIELNLREYFPYFFVSPELVSYEFYMRYPHVKKNDFQDAWNKLDVHAIDILRTHFGTIFTTPWSQDVAPILAMLKLLPTKTTGKNVALMESLAY